MPYDPAIPLPGIYPREMKAYVHAPTCTQMLTVALFTAVKKWSQLKHPSADEWINQLEWDTVRSRKHHAKRKKPDVKTT